MPDAERFTLQITHERVSVPAKMQFSIDHEHDETGEEIKFQIKWQHEYNIVLGLKNRH